MSRPAVAAITPLPFELVFDDGEPLENNWHRIQMETLIHGIERTMEECGRSDYFVGGNNFVYYSIEQAQDVVAGRPYYRGPDVFWVGGVDGSRSRQGWVSWEEGGRLPDVIVELVSPSSEKIDRVIKRDLYARVFRTAEYFLFDVDTAQLDGLRVAGDTYRPIVPNSQGRLRSEQLGVELGLWRGPIHREDRTWARLFRQDGSLIPTSQELAEAERRKAEAERRRADALEAELARLKAKLGE